MGTVQEKKDYPVDRMKKMFHPSYAIKHQDEDVSRIIVLSKISNKMIDDPSLREEKGEKEYNFDEDGIELFRQYSIDSLKNNAKIVINKPSQR